MAERRSAADFTCRVVGNELVFRRERDRRTATTHLSGGEKTLARVKRGLGAFVDGLRAVVGTREVLLDQRTARSANSTLYELAWALLTELCDSESDARSFARKYSKLVQPIFASRAGRAAPLIEVVASDDDALAWYLPVELLPLSGAPEKAPLTCYFGFQAVVVRQRARAPALPAAPGLVATDVFRYRGADRPGVAEQVTYLKSKRGLHLTPEWPNGPVSIDNAILQLAAALLNSFAAPARGMVPRRILHFACHHWPAGMNAAGVYSSQGDLGFGGGLDVPISRVSGRMTSRPGRRSRVSEPLIFLNACQSTGQSLIGEDLIATLFKHGFPNIIGSDALLPDRVAAKFSRFCYDALLNGATLGNAVLAARRGMIHRFENPAGILYTAFGDPDFRIRRPKAG